MIALPHRRLAAASLTILVAAVVAAAWAFAPKPSLALDPRGVSCASAVSGPIKDQFPLDRASDYRTRFPKMGFSPELETTQPAFVVLYEGPVSVAVVGGPPPQNEDGSIGEGPSVEQRSFGGVICVVTEAGPTIYVNVDSGS
jgi:hypothetical protein